MADEHSSAAEVAACANYLKALGDPVRLQIVKALKSGPLTVSDLTELLELEMANVSHHLRVLYHARIVTIEKEGKYSYYQLNNEFIGSKAVTKSLDFGCCRFDLPG